MNSKTNNSNDSQHCSHIAGKRKVRIFQKIFYLHKINTGKNYIEKIPDNLLIILIFQHPLSSKFCYSLSTKHQHKYITAKHMWNLKTVIYKPPFHRQTTGNDFTQSDNTTYAKSIGIDLCLALPQNTWQKIFSINEHD